MQIQTRLLFGVLVACGGTLIPLLSAQAQDAITSQAYAQMNQVQQQLGSGLINSSQASDLMNRYTDVIRKDQQWTAQDGGNLNLPDRLDLQGKLKGDNKRLSKDLKTNGFQPANSSGIFSSLLGLNTVPYGSTTVGAVPAMSPVVSPYTSMPYTSTLPYGSSLVSPYASTLPYGASLASPYTSTLPYGSSLTSPLASTLPYVSPVLNTMPYGAPTTTAVPYVNYANPYTSTYNNGNGYRNRYRGYSNY